MIVESLLRFVLQALTWMTETRKSGRFWLKNYTENSFADKGYISPKLFESLFDDGIHLVTGIKANRKNRLMPLWDRIMLRKRYIIECINDMLKNTGKLVHSRHRSINNFIMNLVSAIAAYCFYDNKPEVIYGYTIQQTKQMVLF